MQVDTSKRISYDDEVSKLLATLESYFRKKEPNLFIPLPTILEDVGDTWKYSTNVIHAVKQYGYRINEPRENIFEVAWMAEEERPPKKDEEVLISKLLATLNSFFSGRTESESFMPLDKILNEIGDSNVYDVRIISRLKDNGYNIMKVRTPKGPKFEIAW